jgi:hypothetical protein
MLQKAVEVAESDAGEVGTVFLPKLNLGSVGSQIVAA